VSVPKTKPTEVSAESHIAAIANEEQRNDAQTLVALMRRVTKQEPRMWGPSIVGFGSYHYKYASGHQGDSALAAFAVRGSELVVYIAAGFEGRDVLLAKLGKHKTGKVCVYIRRLANVDLKVLETLVARSVAETKRRYSQANEDDDDEEDGMASDARYTLPMRTMTHMLRVAAATAFIFLCVLLPFLPGRYDGLAVPLSSMAQVVGTVGIVLVPFGALWMVTERSQRLAARRYVVALLALVASSLVWALISVVAAIQSGFALGLAAVALWVLAVRMVWPSLKRMSGTKPAAPSIFPAYLVFVPMAVALLQVALLGPAVTFSRDRAIRNSARLVAAIEQYRSAHGRYPASLLSVQPDYSAGVMGITKYHYEPHRDAYNLFFEHFTYQPGTQEIVMYNPRDEHVMTSHARSILELTPEQLALERTRGHYALHSAPHLHWKYFWFD